MKRFFLILLFAIFNIVMSCSSSDDSDNVVTPNPGAYVGNWSGKLSSNAAGESNYGTWNFKINSDGNISEGKFYSTIYQQELPIYGSVNANGEVNAILGNSSSTGTFKGNINGSQGNGTWNRNTGSTGTWTGSKN